jgi:metal-responsive CopG/Arc/MetJ family transcriptional regulator
MAPKGRSATGPGKTIVSLYFDTDLVKRIDRLAASQDVSRSKWIEAIVSERIDDEEMTVRVMTDPVVAPAMMSALAKPEILRAMTSIMREQLTDEQLSLFSQVMHTAGEHASKRAAKRTAAKRTPRAVKRQKRVKS